MTSCGTVSMFFTLTPQKPLCLLSLRFYWGILPYVAVFALAYASLRIYSFGVHLDNTIICTLIGLGYYLGSTYLSLYVGIPPIIKGLLLFACIGVFIVYAPAQTKKRPIPEQQCKLLKVKSLRTLAIITVAVFMLRPYPVYSSLLCMAVVCQSVNLLPITYKILREC